MRTTIDEIPGENGAGNSMAYDSECILLTATTA